MGLASSELFQPCHSQRAYAQLVELVEPAADVLPAGHLVQNTEPTTAAYFATAQFVQVAEAIMLYRPTRQFRQAVDAEEPVPLTALPAGHKLQAELPVAAAYLPAAHEPQSTSSFDPVTLTYLPTAHELQLV